MDQRRLAQHALVSTRARVVCVAGASLVAMLAWLVARPGCCESPIVAATMTAGPATLADGVALARSQRASVPQPTAAAAARPAADGLRHLLARPAIQLRQSVLEAEARHGDGGRLYARYLLRQCAAAESLAVARLPEGDDPGHAAPSDANNPATQRAMARLQVVQAACEQFTSLEIAGGVNILATQDAGDDPLLAALDRFGASSADAGRMQLAQMLSHPDPLLLQELGPRLAQRAMEGDKGYWFDGTFHVAEDGQAALALLPCAFGQPCDDSDPLVWTTCLQGQDCAGDRFDLILRQTARGDPARQQRIMTLYRRMAEAVRGDDVDRFIAPVR